MTEDHPFAPQFEHAFIISPTEQGRSLFTEVIADRRAFFRALLQDIPSADRNAVERSMRQMALRLQELDPQDTG